MRKISALLLGLALGGAAVVQAQDSTQAPACCAGNGAGAGHQHGQDGGQGPGGGMMMGQGMGGMQGMRGMMSAEDDARLDSLVTVMRTATGTRKIPAMEAVIEELLAQRKAQRQHMMHMMHMMMNEESEKGRRQ